MASRENQHRKLESMLERQLHQKEKIVGAGAQEECQGLASPALVDIQRRMTQGCSSRLPVCFSPRAKPEHNVTSELVNQDSIGCQQCIEVLRLPVRSEVV